jgi:chromosome partitioning protein
MKTVVITNQKGGVGKTTVAALFAWWLAEKEKARIALVDLDSQKNLTRTFDSCRYDINAAQLFGPDLPPFKTPQDQLSLLAGVTELADLERAAPQIIRNFRDNLLRLAPHFDYCLIDTPPALGLRMTAALIVADYVLCPIELEDYSIDGVTAMIKTIVGVRQRHNPRLKFLGLLANRLNAHSVRQRQALQTLLETYGQQVIPAKISTRSSIPEAISQAVPVWKLAKSSAREAATEVQKAFGLIRERMQVQVQPAAEEVHAST